MLVIPKRHTADFFSLTEVERTDADQLLRVLRNRKAAEDQTIEGFNVGWNCGEAAGQTVIHAHAHLIPRRRGDVDRPAGGVRAVIPSKQEADLSAADS
jgi:diadenosine tetraphosphate (Ap4A) HIT family hydrolase